MVAFHAPPTEDLACNPGLCPDWESNQRPFGSQACNQSTEPHEPGHSTCFFNAVASEYHSPQGFLREVADSKSRAGKLQVSLGQLVIPPSEDILKG